MPVNIKRNSYLQMAQLLSSDGFEFWDLPSIPEIIPQDGDVFVDVTSEYAGRLDLLAFDQYGDEDLWWVIAVANRIELIPSDIRIGMRLRIPAKSYVDSLISRGPAEVL